MKIIFDIGCNEGQNLQYFLKKADYVVGIEANPILINNIKNKFQRQIFSKKLFLENIALSDKNSTTSFYVNKKKNYLSQLEKPKKIFNYRKIKIGKDIQNNERLQYVVPANCWFASELLDKDSFVLCGCTVSPGFDFRDFEMPNRDFLITQFPQHKVVISQLTHS